MKASTFLCEKTAHEGFGGGGEFLKRSGPCFFQEFSDYSGFTRLPDKELKTLLSNGFHLLPKKQRKIDPCAHGPEFLDKHHSLQHSTL